MNFSRFYFNFKVGIDAILTNKTRALLTSLGIIFGVAAVIAMLAIGAGAEKEILEQIRQVGSNNIIIKPKEKSKEQLKEEEDNNTPKKFSPGLTLKDAENILHTLKSVESISPEIEVEASFITNGKKGSGKVIGVQNEFFSISDLSLSSGKFFSEIQLLRSEPVCIIGKNIKTKFFPTENPLGKRIKCGKVWLTVVGVLEGKNISENSSTKLSIRDANLDIYAPVKSVLLRFKNRDNVTTADIRLAEQQENSNDDNSEKKEIKESYHQLDRLVVKVADSKYITASVDVIEKLLARRHNNVLDYEVMVPEMLLKQEQKTKKLFNMVLGVIASISLIVGGIGIMNIMLASVLERIREIGLRLSIGATKKDIVMQFLSEALTISVSGGLLGIILGVSLSYLIEYLTEIKTIISVFSILISFLVSISVGLLFGIAPAKKASLQDPVNSLRHE